MQSTVVGDTIHEGGRRINDVYFPNGGVFSITNRMRDGELVEVATVGREGMLGIGVFLGDRSGSGRTMQQVPDGPVVALAVTSFLRETAIRDLSRDDGVIRAGNSLADDAVYRLQRPARRFATLLPLAAPNSRPSGYGRLSAEAEVSCRHARCASSDCDRRSTHAQRGRTDLHSVWPHTRTQAQTTRSCFV